MPEHLSAESLERYRRRTLTSSELLRADDHLAVCDECVARAGEVGEAEPQLTDFDERVRTEARAFEHDHLSFEQIASLVDEELSPADREIAETHLELCHGCQGEFEDLRLFRASLKDRPGPQAARNYAERNFKERIGLFGKLFAFPAPLRLGAAFALLLLVVLAGFLLWRRTRPIPQIAQVPIATPEASPPGNQQPSATTPPLNEETQIVTTLNDGGETVTLDARGDFKGLDMLSSETRQVVRNSISSGNVDPPDSLAGLRGKAGTTMGSPGSHETFELSSPIGKIVRSDQPRLSWRALAGATRYTVTILDNDLKTIATSPPITSTSWTVPRALPRGRVYTWQVVALKEGKEIISPAAPAPEARFRVLEKAREDELKRVERIAASSHLARGVLYARAGLLDEAERQFVELVAANPQSTVARKLLRRVRERMSK